jgi:hypothetical protein
MPTSSHPPEALAVLSPPVAAYVEATNNFDLERLLALFADDALCGGHALSATALGLSLRGGGWLETVRDVQGHGAAASAGEHQRRDDRDVTCRNLSRLGLCGGWWLSRYAE